MGGKPPTHPPPFPLGLFSLMTLIYKSSLGTAPTRASRYPYQPPPQPSYHHYPRTPYYSCHKGFSRLAETPRSPVSQRAPPAQPTPARPLFPDKRRCDRAAGLRALSAALTPPRVGAVGSGCCLNFAHAGGRRCCQDGRGQNPGRGQAG